MRRFPLLASLIVATALLAGCGDDNQDPVLEPTPLSAPPTTATANTDGDDAGTDATTTDDGDDNGEGDDDSDDNDASTTTTTEAEADGDTVTTTSERLDPDDPDYPTAASKK